MGELSYRRHRFPPPIIQHAMWLYLRFTLSYRDVEELLAERGLEISYETVRRWVLKFGPGITSKILQSKYRECDALHSFCRLTQLPFFDHSKTITHDRFRNGTG